MFSPEILISLQNVIFGEMQDMIVVTALAVFPHEDLYIYFGYYIIILIYAKI
jgi:hypothetical protein